MATQSGSFLASCCECVAVFILLPESEWPRTGYQLWLLTILPRSFRQKAFHNKGLSIRRFLAGPFVVRFLWGTPGKAAAA